MADSKRRLRQKAYKPQQMKKMRKAGVKGTPGVMRPVRNMDTGGSMLPDRAFGKPPKSGSAKLKP